MIIAGLQTRRSSLGDRTRCSQDQQSEAVCAVYGGPPRSTSAVKPRRRHDHLLTTRTTADVIGPRRASVVLPGRGKWA